MFGPCTAHEDDVEVSKSPTELRASFGRKYKAEQQKSFQVTRTTARIALDPPAPTISKTNGCISTWVF